MPYIQRDQNAKIVGRYANPQLGYAEEWVDDDAVELRPSVRDALLPELRTLRDKAMNVLDGIQADALATGDTATALAIRDAKQACRDIPALDVSAATSEAQMRGLYLTEWRRITAMVPAGVRTAFVAVLS